MAKKSQIFYPEIAADAREAVARNVPSGQGFNTRTFDSLCAIASWVLLQRLQQAGAKSATLVVGVVDDIDHCWVEVAGHIIDLAWRQFDPRAPAVRIVPVGHADYSETARGGEAVAKLHTWGTHSPFYPPYVKNIADMLMYKKSS